MAVTFKTIIVDIRTVRQDWMIYIYQWCSHEETIIMKSSVAKVGNSSQANRQETVGKK